MEDTSPQRGVPQPGRTRIRIGDQGVEIPDAAWEYWVRQGRTPPDALVLSHRWTRGVWRRADSLETYHLFLPPQGVGRPMGSVPSPPDGMVTAGHVPQSPALLERLRPQLPRAIWGSGLSVTHLLFASNLGISVCLLLIWGEDYSERLWTFSGTLRQSLFSGWIPVLLIPLFMHASPQHVMGNLLSLVAGGATVEEFYGRRRTLFLYLASGLCGAAFSLLREKPVLSVGASGAIMGMYGVIAVFLVRYRNRFSERQKFKASRIYFPLVVLAVLPSIFHADLLSHVGGFVGGALLCLIVRPRPDLVPWPAKPDASDYHGEPPSQ